MDLRQYRKKDTDQIWELPFWQHPIAAVVVPFFVVAEGRAKPVGTAFFTGGTAPFVITAFHILDEALKCEPKLERVQVNGPLKGHHTLDCVNPYVLHSGTIGETRRLTLLPIDKFSGAPPTDLSIGSLQFAPELLTTENRLSFDYPRVGEKVLSVGYHFENVPEDGFPFSEIADGTFNWHEKFVARLLVAEGTVTKVFTQDFATGYLNGPCFAFDAEIKHGMSGGPIYNSSGNVCGLNSAGASTFFDGAASIGSALHMILLTEVESGLQIGPVRLNMRANLRQLIRQGVLLTDGSEGNEDRFSADPATGKTAIHGRVHTEDMPFAHDNFVGMQAGSQPSSVSSADKLWHFKKSKTSK